MTTRFPLGATILAVLLPCGTAAVADESNPGLVATYSDGRNSVHRIVALPNLVLHDSEVVDPRIGTAFVAEWRGLLRIERAGEYRVLADGAAIELDGNAVDGPRQLATGDHPIRIRFERVEGEAVLQLRWESEFFRSEPVPSAVLRHVEADVAEHAKSLGEQAAIEHGRYLFAESGCANCHAAGDWNLATRRGPDLTTVGSRVNAGWLYAWLKDPHEYRASAVMPVCLETDRDRADVTAFVMSLGSGRAAVSNVVAPEGVLAGRTLFETVGCAKCHDKANNLDSVGSKYTSVAELAEFIANPHATDPHGRMPQMFRPAERHLATSVAAYLFAEKRREAEYETAPTGDAARGAKLFATNGCASCHTVTTPAIAKDDILTGPAFGRSAGLPLTHHWDFEPGDTAGRENAVHDRMTRRVETVQGRTAFAESAGDRGRAFDFDGRTYIEVPHFHRPDTMTISVWVQTTQGGSILTWGRPGGGKRGSRELRMNIGQDGRNSVCYGEYNSDGGWKPVIAKPKDVEVVDGEWHHIAVVRDGTDIEIYVDGTSVARGQSQKGDGDYTDRVLIGALGLNADPGNRFTGRMDDLALLETALSAEQVRALAAGASPAKLARPLDVTVEPFEIAKGCLAEDVPRPLPDYRFRETDRTALQRFLATVQPEQDGPGTTVARHAPLVLHDLRIRQFRCTKCHELNDENIQKGVAVDDEGRIVRIERPPLLTGAGSKLTAEWMRDVLLERKRNRPWLNLRMPHFGDGVHDLPELIVATAGVDASRTAPAPDRALATAGLEMIGERRGKVSCITCHDYRGINRRKDGVVPAPDLADAARTVRHEWFERWMHDPQRLQPGTSMPQLFLDVTPEERELRIEQLWSALYHQRDLPLPKGVLDRKTDGTRIVVDDEPVLFRVATITPAGQIDRAINVGHPGGLNYAFDPVSCRLRYAWRGPYLDAAPAWNGRGGNPVTAGGEGLVTLPTGHLLRIGGTPVAPRFAGYRLVEGRPVFRYRIDEADVEHTITMTETAIVQSFVVTGAGGDVVYEGNSEAAFRSDTGTREDDTITFPLAERVTFEIVMPIAGTKE